MTRTWVLASVCSLVLPGLGHLYLGQRHRMRWFFVADAVTVLALAGVIFVLGSSVGIAIVQYFYVFLLLVALVDTWRCLRGHE